jgi:hypothetical protein
MSSRCCRATGSKLTALALVAEQVVREILTGLALRRCA